MIAFARRKRALNFVVVVVLNMILLYIVRAARRQQYLILYMHSAVFNGKAVPTVVSIAWLVLYHMI